VTTAVAARRETIVGRDRTPRSILDVLGVQATLVGQQRQVEWVEIATSPLHRAATFAIQSQVIAQRYSVFGAFAWFLGWSFLPKKSFSRNLRFTVARMGSPSGENIVNLVDIDSITQ
jgi:hypothetical protein